MPSPVCHVISVVSVCTWRPLPRRGSKFNSLHTEIITPQTYMSSILVSCRVWPERAYPRPFDGRTGELQHSPLKAWYKGKAERALSEQAIAQINHTDWSSDHQSLWLPFLYELAILFIPIQLIAYSVYHAKVMIPEQCCLYSSPLFAFLRWLIIGRQALSCSVRFNL
jgi:hypothetical protein